MLIVAERPIEELDLLLLDTASRTSVVLARLLADHLRKGKALAFEPGDHARMARDVHGSTGAVVIGDHALALRHRYPYVLDLAAAWKDWTGLPFVFAAWIAQRGVLDDALCAMLDHSLAYGLAARRDIAHMWAAQHGGSPDVFERYLTSHIRYRLDERFLAGMQEFFARAAHAELMPKVQIRFAGHGP